MEQKDWKIQNIPFPDVSEKVKELQLKGYQEEKIVLNMIRKGLVEDIYHLTKSSKHLLFQVLHNGEHATSIEHYRSAMHSAIVLSSRAAIDGGLEPAEAFYIMNVHIGLLNQAKNISDLYDITGGAYRAFAMAVRTICSLHRAVETPYHYLTQRVDQYIHQHICNPITVKDVAQALRMNYSYLSHLYVQLNGITLTKRILNMKCEMAKRLLLTSNMTINELSHYMGFSSQSHFQNIFREICGMSPGAYRKNPGKTEYSPGRAATFSPSVPTYRHNA